MKDNFEPDMNLGHFQCFYTFLLECTFPISVKRTPAQTLPPRSHFPGSPRLSPLLSSQSFTSVWLDGLWAASEMLFRLLISTGLAQYLVHRRPMKSTLSLSPLGILPGCPVKGSSCHGDFTWSPSALTLRPPPGCSFLQERSSVKSSPHTLPFKNNLEKG